MAESRRRPWWQADYTSDIPMAGLGRQALFSGPPKAERVAPQRPTTEEARAFYADFARRPYRRATPSAPDDDGFVWISPSPTAYPSVKGNPPGPRSQRIGYNLAERQLRIVFRPDKHGVAARYSYSGVTPDLWERMRRTASTGRFLNRVIHGTHADEISYGPDSFEG